MGKRLLTRRRSRGRGGLLTRHSASTSYMALDVSYALEISLIRGFLNTPTTLLLLIKLYSCNLVCPISPSKYFFFVSGN